LKIFGNPRPALLIFNPVEDHIAYQYSQIELNFKEIFEFMTQKRMCIFSSVGCENKATPRTEMCKNCGAGLNRWSHRKYSERVEYRGKLAVRSARLDNITVGGKKR
jgi:hypothetical protein